MKISAVTVSYNAQSTIALTVDSFLKQTHPDKEMLVVDGCSTDSTIEIVKSFASDAIRVISEKDSGIYDAMNKGLAHFSGDAVGFLNSDDVYHDNFVLERIAMTLEQHDAIYGDVLMLTSHVDGKVVRSWKAGSFRPGAFRRGWMPPHPTFYIRRALAKAVGAFDCNYTISSDYDFMLRALELHDPSVGYIPHPLVDFIVGGHSTNGIRSVIKGNLECLKSRRKYLDAPVIDTALFLKPARKLQQLRWK